MSMVTSVVVIASDLWSGEQKQHLGRVLYRAHTESRGQDVDPDSWYRPLPDKVGDVYLSDGGKVPGGTIWWLGLNYADMDAILAALEAEEAFHGVMVWWHNEYEDEPRYQVVCGHHS